MPSDNLSHGAAAVATEDLEARLLKAQQRVHTLELAAAEHRESLSVAESALEAQCQLNSAQTKQLAELAELPRENAQLRNKLAQLHRSTPGEPEHEDLMLVVRRLRAKLDDVVHHEAEAARLREENRRLVAERDDSLLLREENRTLLRRADKVTALEALVAELRSEIEQERAKNSDGAWATLRQQLGDVAPEAMAAELTRLQQQCVLFGGRRGGAARACKLD